MRKSVISALIISSVSMLASAQTYIVEGKKQDTWYVSGNKDTDCKFHVKNTSSSNVSIKYKRVEASIADNAWMFQFCDNSQCFAELVPYSTALPIKPNEVMDLKITANPSWKVGVTHVRYAIWDIADSTKTDTLDWTIICQWGLNTKSGKVSSSPVMFPNPAAGSEISIQIPGASGRIEICDLTGKVLVTRQFANEFASEVKLDIANLQSGIYTVVLISDNKDRVSGRLIRL